MPEPPLLVLCNKADVADLVLQRLPLDALACLGATCRGLRALLDEQPQALWQAAAAAAGYADTHPVRCAPDVRAWKQQQRVIHRNLASGCCSKHALSLPAGAISSDFTRHACLAVGSSGAALHVTELLSGTLLRRWPLPKLDISPEASRDCWDAGSDTIVLTFGRAWGCTQDVDYNSGLVLLGAESGSQVVVQLPSQEQRVEDDEIAYVHGWSGTGLLLAEHDNQQGVDSFSVFDARGAAVATFVPTEEYAEGGMWQHFWDPAGKAVVLQALSLHGFWLWWVHGAATNSVQYVDFPEEVRALAWGPSDALVYGAESGLVVFDALKHACHQQEAQGASKAVWGHYGIVLVDTPYTDAMPPSSFNIRVCRVDGAQLTPLRIITLPRQAQRVHLCPQLSSEGRHLLLDETHFTANPDGHCDVPVRYRLQVLDVVSGLMQEQSLWQNRCRAAAEVAAPCARSGAHKAGRS